MRNSLHKLNAFLGEQHARILALLLTGLLAAGFFYARSLADSLRFLPDEADYVQLAVNLTAGRGYSLDGIRPTAYRAPGYPLLLAGIRLLGGGITAFRLANFALLGASLWLMYRFLADERSPQAGAIGGLLVIGYPVLFFTAGTLYPQTLAAFLFLLSLYLLTRPARSGRMVLLTGLLTGYLILAVPLFILVLPFYGAWLWISDRAARLARVALLGFAVLAVLTPWMLRNYLAFGAFVPLATNSGEVLLYGNSPQTTPNAGTNVDISKHVRAAASLGEVERDRYYRARALDFIRRNPLFSLRLYALKVLNYFNFSNRLATAEQASPARDLALLLSYGLLLGTTAARLLLHRAWPLSRIEVLFLALYLASALVHAVFFTRIRLRLPFDYLLVFISALLFSSTLARLTHMDQPGRPAQAYPGR